MGDWTLPVSSFPFRDLAERFLAHRHRRPAPGELEAMMARIERAMDMRFLPPATLQSVDEITEATIWIVADEGRPEGLSLWIPLSLAGATAILAKQFDPEDIDRKYLAPAGRPFSAVYHWGYCGFTRLARRSIMTLCAELLEGPLRSFNVYGRVVTEEGAAAAARLGITPCFELGDRFYVHHARPEPDAWGAVA